MPEVYNPYAVSPVLMREAQAKDPIFAHITSPLEAINFSSDSRSRELIKNALGLDSSVTEEHLAKEIELHQHVDQFVKDMQEVLKLKFKYPLLSKFFSPRAELKIPLEYLDSERQTEFACGSSRLRLGVINSSLLLFHCFAMAHLSSKSIHTFTPVLLVMSVIQAHMSILCFVNYNKLKSKIVRVPKSLNDIKNPSLKRLLQAVRANGFYTKYHYDYDCIQIELSNKPKDLPVEKDLKY